MDVRARSERTFTVLIMSSRRACFVSFSLDFGRGVWYIGLGGEGGGGCQAYHWRVAQMLREELIIWIWSAHD